MHFSIHTTDKDIDNQMKWNGMDGWGPRSQKDCGPSQIGAIQVKEEGVSKKNHVFDNEQLRFQTATTSTCETRKAKSG